jgi:hypothetical protein
MGGQVNHSDMSSFNGDDSPSTLYRPISFVHDADDLELVILQGFVPPTGLISRWVILVFLYTTYGTTDLSPTINLIPCS